MSRRAKHQIPAGDQEIKDLLAFVIKAREAGVEPDRGKRDNFHRLVGKLYDAVSNDIGQVVTDQESAIPKPKTALKVTFKTGDWEHSCRLERAPKKGDQITLSGTPQSDGLWQVEDVSGSPELVILKPLNGTRFAEGLVGRASESWTASNSRPKHQIWIVTTGSHSDYDVHSVWSTEELAKQAVEHLHEAAYFSAELDAELPKINAGLFPWEISMAKNGDVFSAIPENFSTPIFEIFEDRGDDPYSARFGRFVWRGYAIDRDHAIKICNEKRLQALALQP
jgi:hypothetical protein